MHSFTPWITSNPNPAEFPVSLQLSPQITFWLFFFPSVFKINSFYRGEKQSNWLTVLPKANSLQFTTSFRRESPESQALHCSPFNKAKLSQDGYTPMQWLPASWPHTLQHIGKDPASISVQATKPREGQEGSLTGRQGVGMQIQFIAVRIVVGG